MPIVPGTEGAVADVDEAARGRRDRLYPVAREGGGAAAAGAGSASPATRTSCARRSRARRARPAGRSATTGCTSSASSSPRATSRCRCSATARAMHLASASARCSGAARRSSRRRRRPTSDERRTGLCAAAVRLCERDRLPQRGHRRVPGRRRERRVLLHRDEHAHPGRAPGDRARDRRRPGGRAAAHRPARARRQDDVGARARARAADQRRGPGQRLHAQPRHGRTRWRCPPAPGCAWTRGSSPAARSRRSTTRCSAS